MNRLTGRNENGDAIINMDGVNSEFEARQRIREYSGKIIKKLCEYEEICDDPNELHARLEKAVVLKVNVRDTLYMPWKHNGIYGIATLEILEIRVGDEVKYITDIESDDEVFLYKYKCGIFSDEDFDNMVFTDRTKAEARLAELKGGEGE